LKYIDNIQLVYKIHLAIF